jgi:hypothetical protein
MNNQKVGLINQAPTQDESNPFNWKKSVIAITHVLQA